MKHLQYGFAAIALTLAMSCKSQKDTTSQVYESPTTTQRDVDRKGPKGDQRKGPPSADEVFKMDANGDGFLAKSELKGRILERFDIIDADGNGLISRDEFENAPKPERGSKPPRG